MADEIERRFLVHPSRVEEAVRNSSAVERIVQGYLGFKPNTVRLDHRPGRAGLITVTGLNGLVRLEIPDEDAQMMRANDLKDPDGFINADAMTVRVRIKDDRRGLFTLKGRSKGITCPEYEYALPLREVRELMSSDAQFVVHKTRHSVPASAYLHVFEVDRFHGILEGRTMAEVELGSENEPVVVPGWCGPEISGMRQFSNLSLGKLTVADLPALDAEIAALFANARR